MKENNRLALIIAYYLSKFDIKALQNLGYNKWKKAFEDIGKKLGVNKSTIKNMRDDFDPLHPNNRVGWYQRELRPSRLDVVDKYKDLSEEALTEIVKDILNSYDNKSQVISQSLMPYIDIIENDEDNDTNNRQYTTRGITGKKAEEIFKNKFEQGLISNFTGKLIDKRENGCGYDFEMKDDPRYMFEVKGSIKDCAGIMFTDKEWHMAKQLGEKYILVIVSNVDSEAPNIEIYINPANLFAPSKIIQKKIAVNWTVDNKQLTDNKKM